MPHVALKGKPDISCGSGRELPTMHLAAPLEGHISLLSLESYHTHVEESEKKRIAQKFASYLELSARLQSQRLL